MIHSRCYYVKAGKASLSTCWVGELLQEAPELTWNRSPAEALECIHTSAMQFDRYELGVWFGEGQLPVGAAIAVLEHDDHVGECLSVQWRFVEPAHRGLAGRVLHKAIIKLARQLKVPVLAYTRRTGLGKYELRYIRV